MCFHLIFNSRLKCVRAICFCVDIVIHNFFFSLCYSLQFPLFRIHLFIILHQYFFFLCVYFILYLLVSSFRLFCVLNVLYGGYLMWGLICLVKHANSSKGLFKITNLACLFDSSSPFICCHLNRLANHKPITSNREKKKDYTVANVWIFSIICLFTFKRTPF